MDRQLQAVRLFVGTSARPPTATTASTTRRSSPGSRPRPVHSPPGSKPVGSSTTTQSPTRSTPPPIRPHNTNQRFWKDYIDYVLGFRTTSTTSYTDIASNTGYGSDFTWGTVSITAKPTGTSNVCYMNYADNPKRPKLRFWFGPITMIDFLGNYNLLGRHQLHQVLLVARHLPRVAPVCLQAGHPRRSVGHQEEPSQRHGVVDHV